MADLQKVRQAIAEATDPKVGLFRERPLLGLDSDADDDRIGRFADVINIVAVTYMWKITPQ